MREFLAEAQRNAYLPLLIGLALILSGWGAAMTTVGAQFIYAGTALVILAMLLSRKPSILLAGCVILFFGWAGPLLLIDQLS
jgi:hypothetical protein